MVSPELLRRYALLGGLPHQVFDEVAQFCQELELEADMYLFEQGDKADKLYLIVNGAVDLLIDMDEEGEKRSEVETVVVGEFVGWSGIIAPHTYKLSAVTITKSHLIEIDAALFRAYLEDHPEWGYQIMVGVAKIIADRLTNMRMRLMSFAP